MLDCIQCYFEMFENASELVCFMQLFTDISESTGKQNDKLNSYKRM